MKSKFRVGDKIIKTSANPNDSIKAGEIVTVIIHPNGRDDFTVLTPSGHWWITDSDRYEYAHIYNSPLYKALT